MNKYIYSDQITDHHICVTIFNNHPCILGKGYDEPGSKLGWFIVGFTNLRGFNETCITKGNCYDISEEFDTIQKMVDKTIDLGYKVQVYHSTEWKEAFQYLIDNA